jgi:DNA modification methylase
MTGAALVVQGDALHLPLPDGSVDLVCTSPPYLWKRKYAIDGDGEMGNEANWRLYLDGLFAATDEMLRVLKPTGSIFANLGDTRVAGREPKWLGIPPKSRLLLPERYRVGCQDRYAAAGVVVRQVQIWLKVNGLPESTTDRTRDSHEDWVQLVKGQRYYSALDEIREPHTWGREINPEWWSVTRKRRTGVLEGQEPAPETPHGAFQSTNPLGKLPGSVWAVPSEPLRLPAWLGIAHYAAFPSELVRRIALAFSPPGICLDCGAGRVPVVERQEFEPNTQPIRGDGIHHRSKQPGQANSHGAGTATILGYACSCTPFTDHPGTGGDRGREFGHAHDFDGYPNVGADWERTPSGKGGVGDRPRVGPWREYHLSGWRAPPTRPSVVLDPFSGTGTVPMVSRALGRIGVGVDLSHSYSRAAKWRVHHDGGKAISRTWVERQGSLL